MAEYIRCAAGSGKFLIEAYALPCGRDWTVSVFGGELPHVGAVSLGQYEPVRESATVSTVTVHTHRDDVIAANFAKRLAAGLKCTVTVSVGIHVDSAGASELAALTTNCEDCLQALLKEMEVQGCD